MAALESAVVLRPPVPKSVICSVALQSATVSYTNTSRPVPPVRMSAPAPPEPGTAFRNPNKLNTFGQLWPKRVTTTHRPPSRPTPAGGPPGRNDRTEPTDLAPSHHPAWPHPPGSGRPTRGQRAVVAITKKPAVRLPLLGAAARSGVRGWGRGQTVAGLGWRAATAGAAVSQPTATVAASEAASSTDWSRCEYLCVVRSWA